MSGFVLGSLFGLVVGWNFLPQPQFVKNAVEKVKTFVKNLISNKV